MSSQTRITIPAGELYWGIIVTEGFPPIPFAPLRQGALERRLANQFDALLPIPVEGLHTVFRPIGPGRVLACGIGVERIREIREQNLLEAVPDTIPDCIANPPAPDSINLLTGPYLAKPLASKHAARRKMAAAAVLLFAILISVGNTRRAAAYANESEELRREQSDLYLEALGPTRGGTPPAIRLTTELRRLSLTRGENGPIAPPPDAPKDLQALFELWPTDAQLRVDRIAVGGDRIDIAASASDTETIQRLINQIANLPGWSLPVRRIDQRNAQQGVSARLGFERNAKDGGTS